MSQITVCVRESFGNNSLLSPLSCNLKVKGEWVSVLAPPSLVVLPSLRSHMHPRCTLVHFHVICHVHSLTDGMNDWAVVIHQCCVASVVKSCTVL